MNNTLKPFFRTLSAVLCIAMLVAFVPALLIIKSASGKDGYLSLEADPSTINSWQSFFPVDGDLSTENAGGIWTDKSVFKDNSAFPDISMGSSDHFLVALSAISSNIIIKGQSVTPTDTMLVLDVSGSMKNSATKLIEAANQTIKSLLKSNKLSRVGVVLYSGPSSAVSSSGNDATLILPLARYTTKSENGNYLTISSSNNVSIDETLVYEGTQNGPTKKSKSVSGGTYIQNGINLAKEQFISDTNETTANIGSIGTVKRKPIVVLMSDGAPTLATTDFTSPKSSNMGNGTSSSAAMGFATQLSLSYAKLKIEQKYENDALFYTMGVGLTSSISNYEIARYVIDPSEKYTDSSANAIRGLWSKYKALNEGQTLVITEKNETSRSVTKNSEEIEEKFVDKHFAADTANDISNAFKEIVNDISFHIETSENISGYITFRDSIGKYMVVNNVDGIRIGQSVFSGAEFSDNAKNNAFGSIDSPTALGKEFLELVMNRIGITDVNTARALICLAYENGQIRYNSNTDYSNYIGWIADKDDKFLGFWTENMDESTLPSEAVSFVKSYLYFGSTDTLSGIEKSNLMYINVDLRKNFETQDQVIDFAIPASLIPAITYEVQFDENGDVDDITVSGAIAPIRLLYRTSLDDKINRFNVNEIVEDSYLSKNTNNDGSVNFYSNKYDLNSYTTLYSDNTVGYFKPSRTNERYYYQQDSLVYTAEDENSLYRGTEKPTDEELYYTYIVYYKQGSGFGYKKVFKKLSEKTLSALKRTEGADTWYIPSGTLRQDYNNFGNYKQPDNISSTLPYSAVAFEDTSGHSVDEAGHYFVAGVTLGNNGRVVLKRESGIKLTKELAEGVPVTDEEFSFIIKNKTNPSDSLNHSAYKIGSDGKGEEINVAFSNGIAQNVTLKAGETLYIGGMKAGDKISVEEVETEYYAVSTVNGKNGRSVDLTIASDSFVNADFVNTERGTGNITISKQVIHPFGPEYIMPDEVNSFKVNVTLTLNGKSLGNREYAAKHTGNSSLTKISTNDTGSFELTLSDNDRVEIYGLPSAAVAAVAESGLGQGFKKSYSDSDSDNDGIVEIEADKSVWVEITNIYEPKEVSPINVVLRGTKHIEGRTPNTWIDDDVYSFVLERYDFDNQNWKQVGEKKTVNKDNKSFDLSDEFNDEGFKLNKAGVYYYRVREEIGNVAGITYDASEHDFFITVADQDMDGMLEITSVEKSEKSTTTTVNFSENTYWITSDFTNMYKPNQTNAVIFVSKKVINESGSTLASLEGFSFEIYENIGEGNQVVLGKKVATVPPTEVTGVSQIALPYTAVGVYRYAVKEINGNKTGWNYSDTVIPVTVTVTDNGKGALVAVAESVSDNVKDNVAELEFVNVYAPKEAELTIDFVNKHLDGRDLKDGEFSFKITFIDGPSEIGEISGTNLKNGDVIFSQSLKFNNVGMYTFDISEVQGSLGGIAYDTNVYRLSVDVVDDNGVLNAAYHIVNTLNDEATFENTYSAKPVKNIISGTKEMIGRPLLNDEFVFALTVALDSDGTVEDNALRYTVRNIVTPGASENSGEFYFPENTYDEAGTYYYTVTELSDTSSPSDFGVEYSKEKYVITVVVKDDGNGQLVIDSVSHDKEDIKFINKYTPAPTSAFIPGNKILEGRVQNMGEFSFELYRSDEDWNFGEKLETVSNAANGEFAFNTINFDTAGTYYYLVKETEGNKGGIVYDDTVFKIKIEIIDDLLGNLTPSVFIYDDSNIPTAGIEFVNTYSVTGNDTVVLNGSKYLDGRDMIDGEFIFELYKADDKFVIDGDAYKTATNISGKFKLELVYGPEDAGNTFYYVLKEKNAGQKVDGVTYSSLQYFITVKAYDDGEGNVKTETKVTQNGFDTVDIVFTNTYVAKETETKINGVVELEGNRDVKEDDFTFDIYITDEDFQYSGTPAQSVKNKENGKFEFSGIPLTEEKNYYFVVVQYNQNKIPGVTFDKTIYKIKVPVRDNKKGELVTDPSIITKVTDKNESTADDEVFVNTYKPENATVNINGIKNLAGRPLISAEFSFLLQSTDSKFNVLQDSVAVRAVNNADGAFSFSPLIFTKEGTYYYVVSEDLTVNTDRVTFDTAKYYVTVNVTDNTETGKLVAECVIKTESDALADIVVFRNEFIPKADDVFFDITVNKIVENKGNQILSPSGFEFLLVDTASGEKLSAVSDKNGLAKFNLKFTEADIGKAYIYKLTEANGSLENVRYSEAEYTVCVTVTANENNELALNISLNNVLTEEISVEFVNEYDYSVYVPETSDNYKFTNLMTLMIFSCTGIAMFVSSRKRKCVK